jgi:hypothetical protein
VSGRFVVPCGAELGLTPVIVGVPGLTVNALARVTTSVPVVTVTLVGPVGAVPVMDTGTVMLVAVADVGDPAVTAVFPNVTTEAPLKWVRFPAIVTGTFVAPCWPLLGVTDVIPGA